MTDEELKKIEETAKAEMKEMTDEEYREAQLVQFKKAMQLKDGFFSAVKASDSTLACIAMFLKIVDQEMKNDWKDLWVQCKEVADRQLKFKVVKEDSGG